MKNLRIISVLLGIILIAGCSPVPNNDISEHTQITAYDNPAKEQEQTHTPYTGNGLTILHENNLKITYYAYDPDNDEWGPELLFYVENSADIDYYMQTRKFSVNGVLMLPLFSDIIKSGESRTMPLYIFKTRLWEYDIEQVERVEFAFIYWDNNKTGADGIESEIIYLDMS